MSTCSGVLSQPCFPGTMRWRLSTAMRSSRNCRVSSAPPTVQRHEAFRKAGAGRLRLDTLSFRYFMVGCGALGCEQLGCLRHNALFLDFQSKASELRFLKNFALNGVCCGPDGLLTVAHLPVGVTSGWSHSANGLGPTKVTDADRIELSNLTRQLGAWDSVSRVCQSEPGKPGCSYHTWRAAFCPKTLWVFSAPSGVP